MLYVLVGCLVLVEFGLEWIVMLMGGVYIECVSLVVGGKLYGSKCGVVKLLVWLVVKLVKVVFVKVVLVKIVVYKGKKK